MSSVKKKVKSCVVEEVEAEATFYFDDYKTEIIDWLKQEGLAPIAAGGKVDAVASGIRDLKADNPAMFEAVYGPMLQGVLDE